MTTLEERIAEAVAKVHADFGIGEDDGPSPETYARALIADLGLTVESRLIGKNDPEFAYTEVRLVTPWREA